MRYLELLGYPSLQWPGSREDAESVALVQLGGTDDLARAMTEQRQFRSWYVRAPWAMFGLGPLLLLAGAWFVALFILWSGWEIFLPGADTPFVRLHGLAIYYFGVGRLIYFGAPLLIGWGIALIAARQRLKLLWPMAGLVLLAWVSTTARVHASRTAISSGAGHISMNFALGAPLREPLHVLLILSLTMLPYLVWRLRRAYFLSA